MSYKCKGRCEHEYRGSIVGYYKGNKRCSTCEYSKKTDDNRCYCCGVQYRTRSRNWSDRFKELAMVRRI